MRMSLSTVAIPEDLASCSQDPLVPPVIPTGLHRDASDSALMLCSQASGLSLSSSRGVHCSREDVPLIAHKPSPGRGGLVSMGRDVMGSWQKLRSSAKAPSDGVDGESSDQDLGRERSKAKAIGGGSSSSRPLTEASVSDVVVGCGEGSPKTSAYQEQNGGVGEAGGRISRSGAGSSDGSSRSNSKNRAPTLPKLTIPENAATAVTGSSSSRVEEKTSAHRAASGHNRSRSEVPPPSSVGVSPRMPPIIEATTPAATGAAASGFFPQLQPGGLTPREGPFPVADDVCNMGSCLISNWGGFEGLPKAADERGASVQMKSVAKGMLSRGSSILTAGRSQQQSEGKVPRKGAARPGAAKAATAAGKASTSTAGPLGQEAGGRSVRQLQQKLQAPRGNAVPSASTSLSSSDAEDGVEGKSRQGAGLDPERSQQQHPGGTPIQGGGASSSWPTAGLDSETSEGDKSSTAAGVRGEGSGDPAVAGGASARQPQRQQLTPRGPELVAITGSMSAELTSSQKDLARRLAKFARHAKAYTKQQRQGQQQEEEEEAEEQQPLRQGAAATGFYPTYVSDLCNLGGERSGSGTSMESSRGPSELDDEDWEFEFEDAHSDGEGGAVRRGEGEQTHGRQGSGRLQRRESTASCLTREPSVEQAAAVRTESRGEVAHVAKPAVTCAAGDGSGGGGPSSSSSCPGAQHSRDSQPGFQPSGHRGVGRAKLPGTAVAVGGAVAAAGVASPAAAAIPAPALPSSSDSSNTVVKQQQKLQQTPLGATASSVKAALPTAKNAALAGPLTSGLAAAAAAERTGPLASRPGRVYQNPMKSSPAAGAAGPGLARRVPAQGAAGGMGQARGGGRLGQDAGSRGPGGDRRAAGSVAWVRQQQAGLDDDEGSGRDVASRAGLMDSVQSELSLAGEGFVQYNSIGSTSSSRMGVPKGKTYTVTAEGGVIETEGCSLLAGK